MSKVSTPEQDREIQGTLSIRTLAMPADTNPNGDIFGGWLMSQMDIAGGISAHARANGRVVTVGVEAMTFHRPVRVGDVVCCYTNVVRIGVTSMSIRVDVWVLRGQKESKRVKVTEGVFTYVAIDDNGSKRALPTS